MGKTDGGYASPQGVYEVSTTKHHRVGTRLVVGDRVFRYARFTDNTAIGVSKLAQMRDPSTSWANHVTETGALVATAGSNRITAVLGATAAFENQYQEGYIKIQSATTTGEGQIYKIRGHAAVDSGGTLTADLYDPVVVTTSGTVTWSLIANPWSEIVIQPITITAPAAGVTMVTLAAASTTAPKYAWIQTWGVASVLCDTSNVVAGSGLIPGGATAGAVGVAVETDIKQRIGVSMEAISTDNIYISAFLQIAP